MKTRENISKHDVSQHPDVDKLLSKIPSLKDKPLVGVVNLQEVLKVISVLPDLEFPIDSAGELVRKLGGSGSTFKIVGVEVDPVRMIKYMPSYYFPIANMENLVEKMAELIQQNRRSIDIPAEIEKIRTQMSGVLTFPIKDRKNILQRLEASKKRFSFQGRTVIPSEMVQRIPDDNFPIKSEEDFLEKTRRLIVSMPLIAPD